MARVKVRATVKPPLIVMMAAVANVAQTLDSPTEILITSANDGDHLPNSKHYSYEALDVRSKTFKNGAAKRSFMKAVLKRLGTGYSMLLEDEGEANEHFHLQVK